MGDMAEDKKFLSEVQITAAVSGSSYFDSMQRQLVSAALIIISRKRGGLKEEDAKAVLRELEHAGLISNGGIDSVMKRLFKD